jgi:membrane-associated phospholipid phosphatase
VYDRYHYFSDVVGGLVFGAVAIILTLAWQRMGGRLD